MTEFAAELRRRAAELPVTLDHAAVDRLARYAALLAEWNRSINLVADASDEALLEHLLDSLAHAELLEGEDLADVGSGAGLPGLVLAALRPERTVTLVESVARKGDFLREAALALDLPRVIVAEQRVELLARDPAHRERYERVTARRLAPLGVLLEYLLPLARVGGRMVVAKGVGLEQELSAAAGVAEQLGGGAPRVVTGPRSRAFVVLDKLGPTPERYPRRVGIPAKRPLRVGGAEG